MLFSTAIAARNILSDWLQWLVTVQLCAMGGGGESRMWGKGWLAEDYGTAAVEPEGRRGLQIIRNAGTSGSADASRPVRKYASRMVRRLAFCGLRRSIRVRQAEGVEKRRALRISPPTASPPPPSPFPCSSEFLSHTCNARLTLG